MADSEDSERFSGKVSENLVKYGHNSMLAIKASHFSPEGFCFGGRNES